jgi:preprotein translocase subunit YajC
VSRRPQAAVFFAGRCRAPGPPGRQEVIVLGSLAFVAQGGGGSSSGNPTSLLLFLVVMVGIFYFLLIRPQRRRQQQAKQLLESLAVGDEVVTIGGLFGTITELDEEGVTLEVAPNVEMRFVRSAIARKLFYEEEDFEDEGQEEEEEEEEADEQR